jgi:transglutaminase-like putative cysteine protease
MEYDMAGCTPERAAELGNLERACDLRKGTCTEFHGIFIARVRAVGVPARIHFGFNVPVGKTKGLIAGYHCWCEVFLPELGWFPVDVTEAIKERMKGPPPERADFFFGGLNCHRVELTSGRDVNLAPTQAGGPIDKLIFPYAVRGREEAHPNLRFRFSPPRET